VKYCSERSAAHYHRQTPERSRSSSKPIQAAARAHGRHGGVIREGGGFQKLFFRHQLRSVS
jgi:hypothetical protein